LSVVGETLAIPGIDEEKLTLLRLDGPDMLMFAVYVLVSEILIGLVPVRVKVAVQEPVHEVVVYSIGDEYPLYCPVELFLVLARYPYVTPPAKPVSVTGLVAETITSVNPDVQPDPVHLSICTSS
jgi:hypothetical protein